MENTRGAQHYPVLLKLQSTHRSECVIRGEPVERLTTRQHKIEMQWDDRYEKYVRKTGLYGLHQIGHIPTDHALISALVERWRQETHTFHFPVGEMTITLQDVAVLLGLPIDGKAISSRTDLDWSAAVVELLGKEVTPNTFRKKSNVAINISWLHANFSCCPKKADEKTVQQYARAYLLMLIGSVLFTDHSGDTISAIYLPLIADFEAAGNLSWGSGALAYLYRELCLATKPKRKQFGGPILLLQLWSWERLPIGRPSICPITEETHLGGEDREKRPPHGYRWCKDRNFSGLASRKVLEAYRKEIDHLNDGNVKWNPYENQMDLLPPICSKNSDLWRTTAPLIHFWIVEMYNPGRVERQFNCYQVIPPPLCDTMDALHNLKNRSAKDWVKVHHVYLQKWENRRKHCLANERPYDISKNDAYKRWFSNASILYLNDPRGLPDNYSAGKRLRKIAKGVVETFGDTTDKKTREFLRDLLHEVRASIEDVRESVGDEEVFAAFDKNLIEQPARTQVHNNDAGPSCRPATKRTRRSSSSK
ncbi:hypothetical protein LUZ62_025892 [Rhynchospora pubera]|uniref:Aminotransferase-like plant mobile domain-containing protein n=1 Tax=Rhynchospora pubera TaxID=906938 RepID=A0AAV8HDJ1_9POAL|nr:hypothetical protein LUZ62_025892 [Rhynchospora pubera]